MFRGPISVESEDELIDHLENIDFGEQPVPIEFDGGVFNFDPLLIKGEEFWVPHYKTFQVLSGAYRHVETSFWSNIESIPKSRIPDYLREQWLRFLSKARQKPGTISHLLCRTYPRYWGVSINWGRTSLMIRVNHAGIADALGRSYTTIWYRAYTKLTEREFLNALSQAIAFRRHLRVYLRSGGTQADNIEDLGAPPDRYRPIAIPSLNTMEAFRERLKSAKAQVESLLPSITQIEGFRLSVSLLHPKISFPRSTRSLVACRTSIVDASTGQPSVTVRKSFSTLRPATFKLWIGGISIEHGLDLSTDEIGGIWERFSSYVRDLARQHVETIESSGLDLPEGVWIDRVPYMPGWNVAVEPEGEPLRHFPVPDAREGAEASLQLAESFGRAIATQLPVAAERTISELPNPLDFGVLSENFAGMPYLVMRTSHTTFRHSLLTCLGVPASAASREKFAEILMRASIFLQELSLGTEELPVTLEQFFGRDISRWEKVTDFNDWLAVSDEQIERYSERKRPDVSKISLFGFSLKLSSRYGVAGFSLPGRKRVLLSLPMNSKREFGSEIRRVAALGRMRRDLKIKDEEYLARALVGSESVPDAYDLGFDPIEGLFESVHEALSD